MLVGRRAERERIDSLLASARNDDATVLAFVGGPGAGKTMLCRYAIDAAAGMRVVLLAGAEADAHLPIAHSVEGRGSGNSRNGSYPKTVTTHIGKVDLRVRRDRNGSFEPVTVPKGQRRLAGLSANVISLYANGMTTGDIQAHLFDNYGTEISRDTTSRITDAVVEDLIAWQYRPLETAAFTRWC
jgi:transposase-like protein